jgi:predicted nucleic acid-binding protein
MKRTVVADASCLIVLKNIDEFSLLEKIFGELLITPEVESEFGLELPNWIKVESARDFERQKVLRLVLDSGEASSIALCLEQENSLLIIDERKGRGIAKELNLRIIGTIGILIEAKKLGLIDSPENILDKLQNAGFRISKQLSDNLIS